MKPIGPLMREHRLIERMVALLNEGLRQMSEKNKANVDLLTVAVDFFRTYADRTHHGKEEDILFRELAKKQLSQEHKRIMNELVQEHVLGRKMISNLVSAKKAYTDGTTESPKDIIDCVTELVKFYPAHIEKEDKHFFYPALEYLSKEEQDNMLEEFWDFDRKLIHEKYQGIVEELETRSD
jgi:hemerythrin-like domain-containing protein